MLLAPMRKSAVISGPALDQARGQHAPPSSIHAPAASRVMKAEPSARHVSHADIGAGGFRRRHCSPPSATRFPADQYGHALDDTRRPTSMAVCGGFRADCFEAAAERWLCASHFFLDAHHDDFAAIISRMAAARRNQATSS